MLDWGIRRRLTLAIALVAVFVIVAWSGTIAEPGSGDLPSWSGLRVALALALVVLGVLYREIGRIHRPRSSALLSRGAFISGVFVIAVPTALGRFDAGLAGSELGLVASIVALWSWRAGSRAREGLPRARGAPHIRGYLFVLIIGVLWLVLTTLPLPIWSQGVIDFLAALVWGGGGLLVLAVGFRGDDEAVSTLGIAALGIAASQLLTLGGGRTLAAEVLALASVAFAVSASYLELIGAVRSQRDDLEATKERMTDLAHEARTALTAIEGTMYGLDHRADLEEAQRAELQTALQMELQSLRLMLNGDEPQALEEIRLADVLRPIVSASKGAGVALHWLAPAQVTIKFAKGALVEIVRALIENARVHSGADELAIEVAINGAGVEIVVVDNGGGVSPAMRPYLFDRGAKRPRSPGRGLGLAIARKLARSHGGELDYRENPAGGSAFVLTVPSGGSVLDLSVYENDEIVETVDGDIASSESSSPDGHRGDPSLPRNPHRHRGPQPGGEVAGV